LRRQVVAAPKRQPQPFGDVPASRPGRRVPPVLAFALVMLGLSAFVGLIAGIGLIGSQPLVGAGFLIFAVLAVGSAWSLVRRERRGYWSSVVLLALIGAVPAGFAINDGSVADTVVLVPPLVMAGILLTPRVRAELIDAQDPQP
jgi:4-hydroxybenzoate polyprenyltransferase